MSHGRNLAVFALAFTTAFSIGTFTWAVELLDSKNFYPLEEGNTWTYAMIVGEAEQQFAAKISKVETIDGDSLSRLEGIIGGRVIVTEHLRQNDKGVQRFRVNGTDVKPPVDVLRYPIKDGDEWTQEVESGGIKLSLANKVSTDEVTVPAGSYKAVVMTVDTKEGETEIHTKIWFAADVGIVKQIVRIGTTEVETRLEKFEPGKKK